jgi:hypothetical protein
MTEPDERVKRMAEWYSLQAPGYARHLAPLLEPFGRHLLDALPLSRANRIVEIGKRPSCISSNSLTRNE